MSFDALADAYDRHRIGYSGELFEAIVGYGLSPGSRVLDLGCGTGIASAALAERGMIVTGIDISTPMLAHARKRVLDATFVNASADALAFPAESFDGAVSAQAFHWFDAPKVLAEVVRVVRPYGVVAIWWKTIMHGDRVRMLRAEVASELAEPAAAADDLLGESFAPFYDAPLIDRRLRVIPWQVTMRVADFLGYEDSRARARMRFGARTPEYLERLAARLGPPETALDVGYVQYLYLGKVRPR
jgi:ubiquinone/menaquinone biosynthesis C-methylase UbiE